MTICLRPALSFVRDLAADVRGTSMIETVVVAPVLVAIGLGTVDAGSVIARQVELQNAVATAAEVTYAATPNSDEKLTTMRNIVVASTGVSANSVTITRVYRCGTSANMTTSKSDCGTGVVASFVRITLNTTFETQWAKYGFGKPVSMHIERMAQIG